MLILFLIGLLFGYGQTGVRLDAILPAQNRVVMGRVVGVGDEVVIVTEGRVFVGVVSLLTIQRNRVYVEAWGEQDGIAAFCAIEAEDNEKVDRMQAVILMEIDEGDFGFPGRPLPCYPRRPGSDAVQIFGGGK